MNNTHLINQWLATLSDHANIPPLKLDDNGVCAIKYNHEVECVLEFPHQGDVIYFYSPMGSIPTENTTDFLKHLLKANLFCLETHGATFAIDEIHNRVILCYPQPIILLDETLFLNAINNFLEIAYIWHEKLKTF